MAHQQAADSAVEQAPPPREHLASVRALPLSRLLGLCGEVGKLLALDGELGRRPLTVEDIHVVSNGTKCLASTAATFETIRVMAPLYGERVVCMPEGVRDEILLAGLLAWLEGEDRRGADELFRRNAPEAFIAFIRQAYPCSADAGKHIPPRPSQTAP